MEIILDGNSEYCVGDVILITFIDRFKNCEHFLYRVDGKTYYGKLNIDGEYQTYHYITCSDTLHIEAITKVSHVERYILIKTK